MLWINAPGLKSNINVGLEGIKANHRPRSHSLVWHTYSGSVLLYSVGVLDWFTLKDPSNSDKTILEVNWNKLHCIRLLCIAPRQARIESYQTDCLKYIRGALNYWVYIEVHIESVTGGEIHSPEKRSRISSWLPDAADEDENVFSRNALGEQSR